MSAVVQISAIVEVEELIPPGFGNLTAEEKEECESFLQSLIRTGGCEEILRGTMAGSFKHGVISACLMGRARRFQQFATSCAEIEFPANWNFAGWDNADEPNWAEMAYDAAAKACDIFPISINFYDFGCLLQKQGRHGKARLAFKEFLRRANVNEIDPVARAAVSSRNIADAIEHACKSL
jgi:hypothetical protein